MAEGVKVFLNTVGMLKYYDIFIAKGYDLESDLPHITDYELEDILMISSQRDRALLLAKAQTFTPSPEQAVYQWLRAHSLDYYFISFVQSELVDLQEIAALQLPNEDLYDELEIVLPGHRKRFERAVDKLKAEQLEAAVPETPVTHGWWGKPKCLPQAKFDFLCVRAFVFSAKDPKNRASVDFMVDSGSDVSTVQESTLEGLNLELIGPVYSCGVHGGNHCNLYKARLAVGTQEMDIEVMGSNYDSLGSRVVRHFRHVIDGNRHIWLPGNYSDPLPAILPLHMPQASSVSASDDLAMVKALPAPSKDVKSLEEMSSVPNDPAPSSANAITNQNISEISGPVSDELGNSQEKDHNSKALDLTQDVSLSSGETGVKNMLNLGSNEYLQDAQDESSDSNTIGKSLAESIPISGPLIGEHATESHPAHTKNHFHLSPSDSVLSNGFSESDRSTNHCVQDSHTNLQNHSLTCPKTSTNLKSSLGEDDGLLTGDSHSTVKRESVKVNQRVLLGHLIPPNLRDTDDDVDHFPLVQVQNKKLASFSKTSDALDSNNKQNLSTLSSQTDSFGSNLMFYAENFVQASSEVLLLTQEDLEVSDPPFSQENQASESQSGSSGQGHHLLCEARPDDPQLEEQIFSPRKKFKLDHT
ncbi:ankyrin repeat and sam domain-containing protein 1a [Plakobranchus ocellatus]|uniref:Ankyrin repeat and sam domain-containing protein 1a n=1 Tax=Plakobranchus ocellatus TaxID=259542 RepID=A0AAV4DQV3_9GAST|nr:ankyrin repeat and sam domain-containing protein 1a [Plakobranchus ocellatus]